MKSKSTLIKEIIDDIRKSLIMDETNKRYIEKRSKQQNVQNEYETQKQIIELQTSINARTWQLEILNSMLQE